ncbi:hypothetical protein QIA00_05000 (plasmid) [Borreliella americana]|uniref:Uncharacterized protein n=1 Tax=Borreliella americana TaxID=478807 RepID=A0ACD5G5Z4_9SPIR
MKSKLEKFTTSGSNLEKVLNKSSQNTSKNFKSLANSVDSVSSKVSGIKNIDKTPKGIGKGLGNIKNLAKKTSEAFDQMLSAFAPIVLAVKIMEGIGSKISGILRVQWILLMNSIKSPLCFPILCLEMKNLENR